MYPLTYHHSVLVTAALLYLRGVSFYHGWASQDRHTGRTGPEDIETISVNLHRLVDYSWIKQEVLSTIRLLNSCRLMRALLMQVLPKIGPNQLDLPVTS